MNTKKKGARNEHRSRRLLETAGYWVTRAAGSLGCWDLIGISATDFLLVQVKSNDWPGSVECEQLRVESASYPTPDIDEHINQEPCKRDGEQANRNCIAPSVAVYVGLERIIPQFNTLSFHALDFL